MATESNETPSNFLFQKVSVIGKKEGNRGNEDLIIEVDLGQSLGNVVLIIDGAGSTPNIPVLHRVFNDNFNSKIQTALAEISPQNGLELADKSKMLELACKAVNETYVLVKNTCGDQLPNGTMNLSIHYPDGDIGIVNSGDSNVIKIEDSKLELIFPPRNNEIHVFVLAHFLNSMKDQITNTSIHELFDLDSEESVTDDIKKLIDQVTEGTMARGMQNAPDIYISLQLIQLVQNIGISNIINLIKKLKPEINSLEELTLEILNEIINSEKTMNEYFCVKNLMYLRKLFGVLIKDTTIENVSNVQFQRIPEYDHMTQLYFGNAIILKGNSNVSYLFGSDSLFDYLLISPTTDEIIEELKDTELKPIATAIAKVTGDDTSIVRKKQS